jgi:hypothetical protein
MQKKKKESKTEETEKKSRAKYKRPDEIGSLIDYVNAVPSNIPLLPSRNLEDIPPSATSAQIAKQFRHNSQERFDRCFSAFSPEYKDALIEEIKEDVLKKNPAIGERHLPHLVLNIAVSRYDDIVAKRGILISIAKFYSELRKGGCILEGDNALQNKDGEYFALPVIHIPLTRDGTKGKVDTGIAAAFHEVELDRLRMCEICSRLFWAENKNSFTCSETCRNALRQRNHRKKNKEEINAKRRQNYQTKKRLEKNKNGTL